MLQGRKLSAQNEGGVPGRPVITSHQMPKMLESFGYPVKHQTKGGSLLNLMQIILGLNILDFQTAKFSLDSANLRTAI